jgi:hypothetical protein
MLAPVPDKHQKMSEFMKNFWLGDTGSEAAQGREGVSRLRH